MTEPLTITKVEPCPNERCDAKLNEVEVGTAIYIGCDDGCGYRSPLAADYESALQRHNRLALAVTRSDELEAECDQLEKQLQVCHSKRAELEAEVEELRKERDELVEGLNLLEISHGNLVYEMCEINSELAKQGARWSHRERGWEYPELAKGAQVQVRARASGTRDRDESDE